MSDADLIQALSPEEVEAIKREAEHLPNPESAAIEALQIVQAKRGWVSDESVSAIGRILGMSAAEVDSVATFYNLIFRRPVGRHVVMVCDSVSCFVMGCERVRGAFVEALGVGPGETTDDGRFTLLPIVCLGACDRAPAVLVGEELIGPVRAEDVPRILERFE